jgi:hypothetical protein
MLLKRLSSFSNLEAPRKARPRRLAGKGCECGQALWGKYIPGTHDFQILAAPKGNIWIWLCQNVFAGDCPNSIWRQLCLQPPVQEDKKGSSDDCRNLIQGGYQRVHGTVSIFQPDGCSSQSGCSFPELQVGYIELYPNLRWWSHQWSPWSSLASQLCFRLGVDLIECRTQGLCHAGLEPQSNR